MGDALRVDPQSEGFLPRLPPGDPEGRRPPDAAGEMTRRRAEYETVWETGSLAVPGAGTHPGPAAHLGPGGSSRSQNERILEQLEALWGDEATAEEALALLKQYGLVDEDGNVITDWSDDIWLQAEPVPLSFGEAMDLSEGTVTVNGRTCDAGELR